MSLTVIVPVPEVAAGAGRIWKTPARGDVASPPPSMMVLAPWPRMVIALVSRIPVST